MLCGYAQFARESREGEPSLAGSYVLSCYAPTVDMGASDLYHFG